MVCRNPLPAEQRARKRTELLDQVVAATRREKRRLKGIEAISLRVGKVIGKYKMARHFDLKITEEGFDYRRREEAIAGEAALDGLYVIRTNLSEAVMDAPSTVRSYKRLAGMCRLPHRGSAVRSPPAWGAAPDPGAIPQGRGMADNSCATKPDISICS